MADIYFDTAGSGTSPYDTWAKAANTEALFQTAILDSATTSDTVYARGTLTLTGTLDVDTQSGSNTTGFIKIIGCAADGSVDGTHFTIDANGGAYHAITWANGNPMYWLENIRITNTGVGSYDGVSLPGSSAALGSVFVNCSFDNCGRYGFGSSWYDSKLKFIRCVFYSNTSHGAYGASNRYFFCSFYDNGGSGASYTTRTFIGCAIFNNTDDGISNLSVDGLLYNCVVDGNTDDGIACISRAENTSTTILASRITNHSGAGDFGVNFNTEPSIFGWNVFDTNDTDTTNASLTETIPLDGTADTNKYDPDADDGYSDAANDDYNLKTSRTYNGDGTDTVGLNVGS